MEIVRDVLLAVMGSDDGLQQKPILIIGHFGVILQLICHMPFIYFIGKEHVLQCVDEFLNSSLSLMVDRIRFTFKGDPRFFLVQRRFNLRSSTITLESEEGDGEVVLKTNT